MVIRPEILNLIPEASDDDEHPIEFYMNNKNQIFVHRTLDHDGFFFVITKEDWEEIKTFIDDQFNQSNG